MRRIYLVLLLILCGWSLTLTAQGSLTLTFTCVTYEYAPVKPDSITIENLTRHWTETIYYPDTVYTLRVGTGVRDFNADRAMLVMPNPFDGTTRVNIASDKREKVHLRLTDVNGRTCAEYKGLLNEGGNLFSISVAVPQTYILTVHTALGTRSLKMENVGHAGGNRIRYEGVSDITFSVQLKGTSVHTFRLGDKIRVTGYAQGRLSLPFPVNTSTPYEVELPLYFDMHGSPCPHWPVVTDVDGNKYNTVQLGNQCWLKENLRTLHYADGEAIPTGTQSSDSQPYCYPQEATIYGEIGGVYYNWVAATRGVAYISSDVQGVCPEGWHVPSGIEWDQLATYVSEHAEFACNGNSQLIVKALSATIGWAECDYTCTPGNDKGSNNATGFNAFPASSWVGVVDMGSNASMWSSSEKSAGSSSVKIGSFNSSDSYWTTNTFSDKWPGASVRCVRKTDQDASFPTVITSTVSDIKSTSAVCGGRVSDSGSCAVTERGVCWSIHRTPTIGDNHTSEGEGMGSFSCTMMNLSPNTTYHVRAYASNAVGTAYGEERSFKTIAAQGPVVNTADVVNVTATTAQCGGTVTDSSTCAVTMRGVCWVEGTEYPFVSDNHTSDGLGLGEFTSEITGLKPNTTYTVRAYATNCAGTGYGAPKQFTTPLALPEVKTGEVSEVTSSSASCGVTLISSGGTPVPMIRCGICWSTSPNPTIEDNTSITWFSVNESRMMILNNLSRATVYYVRACATNAAGTVYGEQVSFKTLAVLPEVTTNAISTISFHTAVGGGSVTDDGGAEVTARGLCWSTSQNPTVADSHTTDGAGVGEFTSNPTGLAGYTTYYVRAYATNEVGTVYGKEISFKTLFPCGETVTDYDKNVYHTVAIGDQCWMKENMRTTHYADGTAIDHGSETSTTVAYYYYPNNDISYKNTWGLLYNFKAMRRSGYANPNGRSDQGACPDGWHIPTNEFYYLEQYLNSQSQYWCDGNKNNIAKALADTAGWTPNSISCTPGNDKAGNNATGFSALPASYIEGNYNVGGAAYFWTTNTQWNDYGQTECFLKGIFSSYSTMSGSYMFPTYNGFWLRCVCDDYQ